ncbi:MAG: hypothetical protein ACK493_09855 [Planctomycetota bacterium]|jgi:hypothetical protein|nr:hypothetical protein [Blastopirellula sp.]
MVSAQVSTPAPTSTTWSFPEKAEIQCESGAAGERVVVELMLLPIFLVALLTMKFNLND